MIVYQFEDPDYGWMSTSDLDEVVEEIKNVIDANNLFPGELTFTVKLVEMSEAEYEALPTTDEIDEGRRGK